MRSKYTLSFSPQNFCVAIAALAILLSVGCGPGKKPSVARDGKEATSKESKSTEASEEGGLKQRKQVKAEVGVSKQGRLLKDRKGLYSVSGSAYFKARDKLIFMQVDRALQFYQAEHGKFPKSHEEYMEKVIRPNNLESQLPKLPEGDFYEYDPKSHELKVWTSGE